MSDRSAYFVSYADGYEEELTMDKLSSITPELIGSVKDSGPVDEGNIVGKLIDAMSGTPQESLTTEKLSFLLKKMLS